MSKSQDDDIPKDVFIWTFFFENGGLEMVLQILTAYSAGC